MDAVTLGLAQADAKRRYVPIGPLGPRQANKVAWLGDSLHANGVLQTSVVGTVTASTAGTTSVTFTNAYPGYPSQGTPAAGDIYVIDPGLPTEEHVVLGGVSGTAPTFTFTVPALTYAHAANAQMRGSQRRFGPLSVPMWTTILSNGRLRFGGVFAHGSYTAAQIQTVYLPQILALTELPGIVIVNVGRNDLYTDAALVTYMQIVDALSAKGILPVLTSAPPATALGLTVPSTWNLKVAREANKRGIPFIDIYSALVNDGSTVGTAGAYRTTFNLDDTHPSEIGAKAWAQAIVAALTPWVPFYADLFSAAHNGYASDTTSYPMNAANAVMLTDTNTDGVPDSWTKASSNAGDTVALVTEPGIPGKMMAITRVAAGATDTIVSSNTFTLIPGHKYRAFLRIKTSGVDAAYANQISTTGGGGGNTTSAFLGFDVRLTNSPAQGDNTLLSIWNWKREIPLSAFGFDFTCPAGLTANLTQWVIRLRGSVASTAYTVQVQPWLVDLTAAGAA